MSEPQAGPETAPSNWNLPNALTTLRIVMVPFFGWALLVDDGQSILWRCVAWALFVAAMITDKALTGMAFVGLSIVGDLWWWVTALVLVREWGITLLRLWVIRHGVMAAGRGGKLKTVLQTFALAFFILPIKILQDDWGVAGDVLWGISVLLMAAAVTVTLVTGADYVVKALAVRREGRSAVGTG